MQKSRVLPKVSWAAKLLVAKLLVALALPACESSLGIEGEACYANGSCHGELVCANDICVAPQGPDAGDSVDAGDFADAGDTADASESTDGGPPGEPGALYVVNNSLPAWLTAIDPATSEQTPIGSLATLILYGDCVWHPGEGALYVADGLKQTDIAGDNELYRVDVATGAASLVGSHGIPRVFALAYHPPTDAIYGISNETRNLYRFDLDTGAATLVASIAVGSINGLSWDSKRSRMVALTASLAGARLYGIDMITGVTTDLGATPGINNNGLTYDPVTDRHWAIDADGKLFRFDPNTGYAATLAAELDTGYSCIAYVPPAE